MEIEHDIISKEVGHICNTTVTPSIVIAGTSSSIGGKQNNSYQNDKACGKKRKTRRFKNRGKIKNTPYRRSRRISSSDDKTKKIHVLAYPQSEAPNNTTQFLMDYHQNGDNFDILNGVENKVRTRDSSTSGDSDNGHFYSSPEEEKEFLNRDFCNTYTRIHEEEFSSLPKNKLIDIIIKLEERIDNLEKKLRLKDRVGDISMLLQENGTDNEDQLRSEMKRLVIENSRLHDENEKLIHIVKESMITSSSSSSSGSCSSDSDDEYDEKVKNQEPDAGNNKENCTDIMEDL